MLLGTTPYIRVGAWRQLVVTVVGAEADESSLQVFRDFQAPARAHFPEGHWSITVLEGLPRGLISTSARSAVREVMANHTTTIHGSAIVIEGDERYLLALRAMMNLLSRAVPQQYEARVEPNVVRAAAWLAGLGAPDYGAELVEVVNALRPGADLERASRR